MMTPGSRAPRIGTDFGAVVAAARAGQGLAFERLYRAFSPLVAGYLRVQGSPDPDGMANEVFLGVFGGIASFSGDEAQFRSWVFTIAHRRLVDERRRRSRRPQIAGSDPDPETPGGDAEDEALRRMSVEKVVSLCRSLSPDQADVLILRMVSGLTIDETAEAVGKSTTAVKALQRRAVGALRRSYEGLGVSQ